MSFSGCEDKEGGESISVFSVVVRIDGKSGVVSKAIEGDIIRNILLENERTLARLQIDGL